MELVSKATVLALSFGLLCCLSVVNATVFRTQNAAVRDSEVAHGDAPAGANRQERSVLSDTFSRILDMFSSNENSEDSDEGPTSRDAGLRNELQSRAAAKADMDRMRINLIKQQILSKLQMTSPPNITSPLPRLPEPIIQGGYNPIGPTTVIRDDRDSEVDRPSEVYIFPDAVSANCYNTLERPMACFDFYFDTKHSYSNRLSAELWIYKLPDSGDSIRANQTFTVSEIINPNHSNKKSGGNMDTITTTYHQGWIRFDLTHFMTRWLRSTRRYRGIEIVCTTCRNNRGNSPIGQTSEYQPFFKISFENTIHSRSRRSPQCGPSVTTCCIETLYVDFREIGWNWIQSPRGYYPNYCRGSCRELTGNDQFHVSRVLDQVRSHTTNSYVRANLVACCAPTATSPLNLIYYERDGSNSLIKRTLVGMIINSCGCV